VDFVISQSSAHYFQTLMEYRRVLRQRNKVLSEAKASRKEPGSATGPWDQQLVTLGSSIICKRNEFVTEFHDYIESAYHHLVGLDEQPTMVYEPMVTISQGLQEAHVAEELLSQLEARRIDELRLGATLVGPHRDEFLLTINGLDLRKFASQGQHKTYLVALKLGEFFYLKDRCHETPILLLDDVFSELDRTRAQSLLSYVRELSQTFITSTDPHFFDEALSFGDRDRKFSIRGGAAVEYQPVAAI
jgi:DNA replication and repair protein RecF